MQATRQQIITILNERGKATVDELAHDVGLTPMAVRHHLNVLQADNLIKSNTVRQQKGPGRPSQIYSLTEAAYALFPSDYYGLTDYLLSELSLQLGAETLSRLFESIAQRLALEVPPLHANHTVPNRLDELVEFLNQKGFVTEWEEGQHSYLIHAYSCPYRRVAKQHAEICLLDKQIIGTMLQTTPTRTSCLRSADGHCTYQVSKPIQLVVE